SHTSKHKYSEGIHWRKSFRERDSALKIPLTKNPSCNENAGSNNGITNTTGNNAISDTCYTDWSEELKSSVKKLRLAMDGLLKTSRLSHSIFRLQEDN